MKHKCLHPKAPLILLMLLFSITFSSCAEAGDIVGTWEITDIIFDGEKLIDLNPCIYHFYADGTGNKLILGEEEFSFQYSYDGTTCILYNLRYPDGTQEAGTYSEMTIKGDKMTIIATDGDALEKITLRRIKE